MKFPKLAFIYFVMVLLFYTGWQVAIDKKDICTAAENVVFFKTHKTGGSSVQNMVMRYGTSRNLLFVVPKLGNDLGMGRPRKFKKQLAFPLKPELHYNILTHHTRFSKQGIASVMPENSIYFTLLRNPVTLFESLYAYFDLEVLLKLPIETFVSENDGINRDTRLHNGRIGRNQMSFDLGLDVADFENIKIVKEFALKMEREFNLIMIAERLQESLILLKHILCWNTEDIVIFHHNARKAEVKKIITPALEEGILRWNRADKFLYDYFSAVLEQKIARFGKVKMKKELEELRNATEYWYDKCVENEKDKKQLKENNEVWSELVMGFKYKENSGKTCASLTKAELPFTEEIQKMMRKYYKKRKRLVKLQR